MASKNRTRVLSTTVLFLWINGYSHGGTSAGDFLGGDPIHNDTLAIAAVRSKLYGAGFGAEYENALNDMGRLIERAKGAMDEQVRSYALRAEVDFLGRRATLRYSKGDYAGALRDGISAVEASVAIGDAYMTASSYSDLGFTYECIEEMPRALDAYFNAVLWADRANDRDLTGRVLVRIGAVHAAMGSLDSADIYLNRALPLMTTEVKWIVQERQVQVSLLRGDTASALQLLDIACAECHQHGVPQGSAYLLRARARILAALGQYDAAKDALDTCILWFDTLGWSDELTRGLIERGAINRMASRSALAERDLVEGLRLAEERGDIASIANATRELMELYHGQGRLAGAFTMLQRHQQANDSIRNTGIEKDLLKLDFKTEQHADSLLHAQQQLASAHQLERERMNRNLLLAGGVMAIIFGSVSYRQRRRTQRALKRSDELLLNILPEEVAEELKTKGHADAKHFDNVTILFTDFKGFTQLSEKVTPSELVAELNTCFKEFDLLMEKYRIEKIKTIGDAYMAAGGLPDPQHGSAADVVRAALEMQDFMKRHKAERETAGKPYFEMRVGIHSGPVVAGIVGVKKFQYDIWGDTVNTASRMESSGEVGQVNISEATHALVMDEPGLSFTSRGKVQAKGKGELEMYFVWPA